MEWVQVSKGQPCSRCRKPDWCSRSVDGKTEICHRVDDETGSARQDRNGGTYYLYSIGERLETRALAHEAKSSEKAISLENSELIAQCYQTLLDMLPLESSHEEQLSSRGLNAEHIDLLAYGSLPRDRAVVLNLLLQKYSPEELSSVPGFCRGPSDSVELLGPPGLLIPVRGINQKIIALRIRPDNPGRAGKYQWLSSKAKGGPGPGAPVHVPIFSSGELSRIRITEGELKADITTALTGVLTIAVPGVSNWRPVLATLKEIGPKTVVLAFDGDARLKRQVSQALEALAAELQANGYQIELETWDGAKASMTP